jgi:hypothetical protein
MWMRPGASECSLTLSSPSWVGKGVLRAIAYHGVAGQRWLTDARLEADDPPGRWEGQLPHQETHSSGQQRPKTAALLQAFILVD